MAPRLLPFGDDLIQPDEPGRLTITVDGVPVPGIEGQSLAGVILASGSLAWRCTSAAGKPRGVFCGIGVCFDCIASVNGQRDVRTCLRRASHGDSVVTQHDVLPTVDALPTHDAVPTHDALPTADTGSDEKGGLDG